MCQPSWFALHLATVSRSAGSAAAQRSFEAGTPYKPTCYESVLLIVLGALGAKSFEVLDDATVVGTVPRGSRLPDRVDITVSSLKWRRPGVLQSDGWPRSGSTATRTRGKGCQSHDGRENFPKA